MSQIRTKGHSKKTPAGYAGAEVRTEKTRLLRFIKTSEVLVQ